MLLSCQIGWTTAHDLILSDVRPLMEEMLQYHVEYKEMTPLLMKRAIKTFIDQFDPLKIYFTSVDIHPFLDMAEQRYIAAVYAYGSGDIAIFRELQHLVYQSIQRHQEWREELSREITFGGQDLPVEPGETHLVYASNEEQLRARLRKQLVRFMREEVNTQMQYGWGPHVREKICHLWQKKYERLERSYTSDRIHDLALHTLKAMARSLDAHTSFFSMEEALEMKTNLEKQFEGFGVILKEGLDGVIITGVVPGGPAERTGRIAPGDLIVTINGASQKDANYDEVLRVLQTAPGGVVRFGLQRNVLGQAPQIFEVIVRKEKILLQQERLQASSIPYEDGVIGTLVLPSFYESNDGTGCEKDLRTAIRELKKQGDIKGLILDLRENAGGFLNQAVKVASLFMSSGVVVISKYAKGQVQYMRNIDLRSFYEGPLIILTSQASASAAEIVAQTLQDYGTALIVGDETTYGKGTIQYQTVTDTQAHAFFKVTVGRYYTVSGKSTQIEGVKADIVVPTLFSAFRIGERFLEYPLSNDQVPPAYMDTLADLDIHTKTWFQKNYLPNLQKKLSIWQQILPQLQQNSAERLKHNPVYPVFCAQAEQIKKQGIRYSRGWWSGEDWQMEEGLHILRDMIQLSRTSHVPRTRGTWGP